MKIQNTFVLLLFIVLLTGCSIGSVQSKPGTTTVVVLTRHADRDTDEIHINARGEKRAQALIKAVEELNITGIFSPDLERNLETAEPLAKKLGIKINRISIFAVFSMDAVIKEILGNHAGGGVVFVGNTSGNLRALYRGLGGTGDPPEEYGQLFIMTVTDKGLTDIKKMKYGPE